MRTDGFVSLIPGLTSPTTERQFVKTIKKSVKVRKASSEKIPAPITIKEIVMHQNPHLDEITGYYILSKYGQGKFLGLSSAPIRFVEDDPVGTDEEFDKAGILPIGCGKGRFDEHRKKTERLEDECAATLIAKYLGVHNKPELKRLLSEVLYFDTHSGCASTQLAEIVKAAHRTTKDTYEIVNWALLALGAIVEFEKNNYGPREGEKTLVEVMRTSVAQGLYTEDERVRQFMFNQMHSSEKSKADSVTELAFIVQALYRNAYTEDNVSDWLVTPLDQMVLDQLEFWKEVEKRKKSKPLEIQAKLEGEERKLLFLVCKSDSLHAQKAARYLGGQVVVVRNSKGNVQIYVDTTIQGLNLSEAARMIRWLELPKEKRGMMEWKTAGVSGEHPAVKEWYYFKKGEMLFNGSSTHVRKPTQLSLPVIINTLQHAFHPLGVEAWWRKHGAATRKKK
ncbi:MAG: hypothetical protein JWO00_623 [Candidatus Parcubacteria bacterium]|nr:hypothetical protein [Candidatus Parcubacteria bacterium]